MRSPKRGVAAFLLVLLAAAGPAAAGNANFTLGLRSLDEETWFPASDQQVIGATVDFEVSKWPVHLAAGLSVSRKEKDLSGFTLQANVTDASFGVMKVWEERSAASPYIGGGLAVVYAKQEFSRFDPLLGVILTVDDSDTAICAYAHGGFMARLGDSFNLGADVRMLFGANIDLFDVGGEANYFQAAVLAGWGWD